jgi:signal transduction histidine kinase
MLEFIHRFFAFNQIIILFIYGQVFFVLGLAIALQSWRYSRLALARHLNWLAAFGFAHGLHEWGDVFIPIQTQYLPGPLIDLLLAMQSILLAVSFACLFQYGVESLRPLPGHWRYVRYIPGAILIIWLLWMFVPAFAIAGDLDEWHRMGNILARYTMGLPSAFLAAYSLRRHAKTAIAPLKLDRIVSMLRLAGLALVGYGIMGGLIVPEAPFFPANVLNQERVQELTLLPVQVYRSLFGLLLTYAFIRALEVFRVELDRRITNMEETQMLLTERERIGRELHDGTLQTVYASGLLLRSIERKLKRGIIDENESMESLHQSIALLDQAVTDIRGYIGQLRPQPTTQNLVAGLKELANSFHIRSLVDVDLNLDLPPELTLTPVQIGHLLAIANEAMSNVARHAQATQVVLSASAVGRRLCLTVEDNGQGLPSDLVVGYGLSNMRDRARLLDGAIHLHSKPGRGAKVEVEIPLAEEQRQHP